MKQNSSDYVYIAGLLRHDALLLEQMYQKFFPSVKRFVMRKGGDEARAKDIFQDALLVVHDRAKRPGFLLTSQFSTLLYGICQNLWRKQQQKKSASQVMIANEDLYNHQSDWELEYGSLKWERRKLYDKTFSQLGERCQDLLLLFFQKVKMEEIAQKLGANSANNAAKQKERCKKKLIELIKSAPEYSELME